MSEDVHIPFQRESLDLRVRPGVHRPDAHSLERMALLKALEATPLYPGIQVLVWGSGSGIVALAAALQGAIVHAVDKDPEAVENTREKHRAIYRERTYSAGPGSSRAAGRICGTRNL